MASREVVSGTRHSATGVRPGRALVAALVGAAVALAGVPAVAAAEDVTIRRDGYGVPHVFAGTSEGVSYGAGYALAQDRLWQMHVFRHIAKGRISEIFGPIALETDKTVRFYTYTQQERARRFATYPAKAQRDLEAFAAGVNAWIAAVHRDPSKMPFEFQEYGEHPIEPWTVDDSIALQDVLILAFGSGGGEELEHAALLRRLVDRLGPARGQAAFDDLVRTTDPDAPATIPQDLNWQSTPTHADDAAVEAQRRLNEDARLSLGSSAGASGSASTATARRGTAAQLQLVADPERPLRDLQPLKDGLEQLKAVFSFGSNAQIVGPALSQHGNSLQTGGPQVGYMVPQWLADFGLHGGGLDTTGMTFAGAGPAVLIGRGGGFAWTTTTGASDLTDTYVVELNPSNRREYRFNGSFEPMDCRNEVHTVRGVPFATQEICRTRHGPVLSFDEENNRAYALRYAWFNREGQTVDGFWRFNEARSLSDYATAAGVLASNHNMFYTDDQGHFGYWHPGNHPLRADGIDLRLPQDGGGGSEWRGLVPNQQVPHAVDFSRGWLANWNNQPVAGWERERAHPARDNVLDLEAAYEQEKLADPNGGDVNSDGQWSFEELNANLRHAAMKDHRETYFRSSLPDDRSLSSRLAEDALRELNQWDGFSVDRDEDGNYDSAGVTILARWLSELRDDVFRDDLADDAGFARTDSELWHVVSPDSTVDLGYDWLNGRSRDEVVVAAFERTARELAEEYGSDDPKTWKSEAQMEHYQRLNSDLPQDLAAATSCDLGEQLFGLCPIPPGEDSGFPGDVEDHIAMDRGTYNHIVSYLDPPQASAPLGASGVESGSVIPPGQSGFVSPTGQEDRHFEDQLPLYTGWRYKPMPLTSGEVQSQQESVETISYTP
jgi:penicillin amidase